MRISLAEARRLGLVGQASGPARVSPAVGAVGSGKAKPARRALPKDIPRPTGRLAGPVEFVVDGRAQPKQSVRTVGSSDGARGYIPTRSRRWMRVVAQAAALAMGGRLPHDGPAELMFVVERIPPLSWSKRKREAALRGEIADTRRVHDIDNISKALCDGLVKGALLADDSLITRSVSEKRFGPVDRVRVVVTPLPQEAA